MLNFLLIQVDIFNILILLNFCPFNFTMLLVGD